MNLGYSNIESNIELIIFWQNSNIELNQIGYRPPLLHHHLVACQDDRHLQHWQTVQGSQPHGYQGRIKVNFTSTKEKLKKKSTQGGSPAFSFVYNFLLSSLVEIGKDHVPARKQNLGHISRFFGI